MGRNFLERLDVEASILERAYARPPAVNQVGLTDLEGVRVQRWHDSMGVKMQGVNGFIVAIPAPQSLGQALLAGPASQLR
jgi:hypothetical protein